MRKVVIFLSIVLGSCFAGLAYSAEVRVITDMAGRQVEIPVKVDRVLCSGPGCLRYLTYLQGQNLIVGVDCIEKRLNRFDARPYALANPQFRQKPLFGNFRGHDNPELILGLDPQPQVIFKTFKNLGYDADELQAKTGIPVVCLSYASLVSGRQIIYDSLLLMGEIIGKRDRAVKVNEFMEMKINDLERRTANIPESERFSCFVGGIAKKGPHGFQSTEPGYPPFYFVNANNVANPYGVRGGQGKPLQHANVSKEQVVGWDPDIIFVDLSSTQLGERAGAINELRIDPVYQSLAAVENGWIYGLLPYNWYTKNYGSIIANAYFVGKVLYPEIFKDVDPKEKADEIYSFLVGKPVFSLMDKSFAGAVFEKIELR
jgi:iron complex transport system substrate-binding protein